LITNVISSSGALTIAGNMSTTLGSGRTFNFGGAGDTTVNGSIIDGTSAVSVSKNGAGSLTLAGNNSYSGTTSVSAGTLFISGELGISNISVSTNATIGAGDASGVIGGNLHFASGAILDVSAGILTVGDTATLSFDGFDFNSLVGFDVQSAAIGTYTLIDGDFALNSANLAYYGIGNAFTRLDGNKAYFDQGSLTVTITAIPEPSAALLGGLGMLVLLRRRR
jgi:autotransporter-associated beta strand protein